MVRVTTAALTLALLLAAPASPRPDKAPTYYYRVTGGSMTIETREAGENTGFERLTWSVVPHARGTRPARGFPTADGSGGLKSFQVQFPVRGTYTYDYDEAETGTCRETFALTPASRGTAAARQVGSRIKFSWGLNPKRRAGYVAHECRPRTNNALLYVAANQPATTVILPTGGLVKQIINVNAQGRRNNGGTTLTWELSLDIKRLGHR